LSDESSIKALRNPSQHSFASLLTPGKDKTRLFQSFTAVAGTVWISDSIPYGVGPRGPRQ